MDITKSHGFFLASFFVLMFLGDLTEAFRCEGVSLQKACVFEPNLSHVSSLQLRHGGSAKALDLWRDSNSPKTNSGTISNTTLPSIHGWCFSLNALPERLLQKENISSVLSNWLHKRQEMNTTKPHGFFLAIFLVLVFLGELTEACTRCKEISLREACCKHDFVMRVEFKSVKQDPSSMYFSINKFSIQPIQVFKGPGHIRNARVLYSPKSEYHCGYQHKGPLRGDDYLISGWIDDNNTLDIKKCNLAIPWEE
ncbi:putative Metalloprotein, partial [Naja naja]